MRFPDNAWLKVPDKTFRDVLIKNYSINDEFKTLIDQMILNNFNFTQLNKFRNIFFEYFRSYSLCNDDQNTECKQTTPGYRFFLQTKNNYLFLKLKKCLHKKNAFALKQNYVVADFPQEWINPDLKDKIYNLDNKERGKLVHFFLKILNPTNNIEKKWLFLNGEIGVGKTFLTVFFANAFINKIDKKVIFINSNNLFNFFRQHIFDKTDFVRNMYKQLNEIELLIIDDFGNENKLISFRDEFLVPLVNKRHNKKLLTFFLSNLTFNELKNFYSFSRTKAENTKLKNFFNLLDQNCNFITLKKLTKKNQK